MIDEASNCLRLLSGRAHRVYTGVCLITPAGKMRQRLVETRVRFKRLSREEIESYLASGEWRGKAGGYAIQGLAGAFVVKLVGSYTNVVGLPLYETVGAARRRGLPGAFQLADRDREPMSHGHAAPKSRRCGPAPLPECGKPSARETYPFCSTRCKDIDLNRWLSGAYVIPGATTRKSDGGTRRSGPSRRRAG